MARADFAEHDRADQFVEKRIRPGERKVVDA